MRNTHHLRLRTVLTEFNKVIPCRHWCDSWEQITLEDGSNKDTAGEDKFSQIQME